MPFISLAEGSPELAYLKERRAALGGFLPQRRRKSAALPAPPLVTFERLLKSSGEREISTTMAFVQMLGTLVRDKAIGKHIVPIVPDESRTFGMEGMFRQLGIYSAVGPALQAAGRRSADVLPRGQGRAGAAGGNQRGGRDELVDRRGDVYSTNNVPMIPFYIYYSMFGLQRVGDLAWAAGDMRARGFLMGGTAGRTTLNGEGLQHEDGHSHVLASTIPNCISYDPDVRVRGHRDHPRRDPADVRGAAGLLLLLDADERELCASGDARRRRGGNYQGSLPAERGCERKEDRGSN
jgi:pyruvate dehydrogenase E1 component